MALGVGVTVFVAYYMPIIKIPNPRYTQGEWKREMRVRLIQIMTR